MAVIRLIEPKDVNRLGEIHARGWQVGYKGIFPDEFLDSITAEDRASRWLERANNPNAEDRSHWTIEDEGNVQGFLSIGPNRDPDLVSDTTYELFALYVDPQAWGKSYGHQLTEHGINKARELGGWNDMTLWVLADNARGRKFYKRQGFVLEGGQKDWDRGGVVLSQLRYRIEL